MLRLLPTAPSAVLGTIYTLGAIAATRIPLLGTLGYESAVGLGVLAGCIGTPVMILLARRPCIRTAESFPDLLRATARLTLTHILLLAIPAAILTANALLVPNCAPFEGAMAFLLIPVCTAAFVSPLALLLTRSARGGWMWGLTALVLLSLLAHAVVSVLAQPQLYVFNHLFGFFVGFSWDEARPPLETLALYRTNTIAYAVLMVVTAHALSVRREGFRAWHPAARGAGVLCALWIGIVFARSDDMGISASARHTAAVLGARIDEPGFSIVYDPSSLDSLELHDLLEEHRFRIDQVAALLETDAPHVTTYLYPDAASKRRLLGTESSQIARPWMREMHLDRASWRDALAHELTHVIAGRFGPWPLRVPVLRSLGLTEGLAMAVEWNYGNRTLHEYAAGMRAAHLLPPLRRLLSTHGFLTGLPAVGYVGTGSFVRWLAESEGMAAVHRAYAADDIEMSGYALDTLERRWHHFLDGITRGRDSLAIRQAFTGQSMFTRTCPRTRTELNRTAAAALDSGDLLRARTLYDASDRMAPNSRAVYGAVEAMLRMGDARAARARCDSVLSDVRRAHVLAPLELWRGDASMLLGDSAAADRAYSTLITERPIGWPTDAAVRRRLLLRSISPSPEDAAADATARAGAVAARELDRRLRPRGTGADQDFRSDTVSGLIRRALAVARHPALRDGLAAELAVRLSRAARRDSAVRAEVLALLAGITHPDLRVTATVMRGDLLWHVERTDEAERLWLEARRSAATRHEQARIDDRLQRAAWRADRWKNDPATRPGLGTATD